MGGWVGGCGRWIPPFIRSCTSILLPIFGPSICPSNQMLSHVSGEWGSSTTDDWVSSAIWSSVRVCDVGATSAQVGKGEGEGVPTCLAYGALWLTYIARYGDDYSDEGDGEAEKEAEKEAAESRPGSSSAPGADSKPSSHTPSPAPSPKAQPLPGTVHQDAHPADSEEKFDIGAW